MFNESSAQAVAAPVDSFRVELEPEIVVPVQFFTGVRNDSSLRPEKRLMLAVLEETVADFQKYVVAAGHEHRRAFRDSEDWFASGDRDWPCSFENVCEVLDLDAGWIRRGLARWRDTQRARHARGEPVVRQQIRRVAGYRSKATGRTVRGRSRSRW